jgi:hypothetical protein
MTGKLANKVAVVTGGRWDRSRFAGSIASIKGLPSFSVYNASKPAVRSFARSWIADLKGRAIRINVLSPGHVETPGPVRPDVGGAESGDPLLWSHWAGSGRPTMWAKLRCSSLPTTALTSCIELFVDHGVAQI